MTTKRTSKPDPGLPVTRAASQILRSRLDAVYEHLPLAANNSDESLEHVHQLRVATRRAAAAIRLFQDLLPRRRVKKLRKRLRKIRSSAARARDLDVLVLRLKERAAAGCDQVIRDLNDRRRSSQKPLKNAYRRAKRDHDARHASRLIGRIRWRGGGEEPTFEDVARHCLRAAVDGFFEAANADLSNIENLHEMRIRGKRLRYAIELLAPVFGKSFRKQVNPDLKEVQERLGAIHDCAVARKMFRKWSRNARGHKQRLALKRLSRLEKVAMKEKLADFFGWWTHDRATELQAQFNDQCSPALAAMADSPSPHLEPQPT